MDDENPYAPPKGLLDDDNPEDRNIVPGKGSGIISLIFGLFSVTIFGFCFFWATDSVPEVFLVLVLSVLGAALGRHALKTDEHYLGVLGIFLNLGTLLFVISVSFCIR